MLARGKVECNLCLSTSEVTNLFSRWQWQTKVRRAVQVDQQVVVARVFRIDAGGGDSNVPKTKADRNRILQRRSVLWTDEVNLRSLRCWRSLYSRLLCKR